MPKHKPTVVWSTYGFGKYPYAYVATSGERNVTINFFPDDSGLGYGFTLTRSHARLLAKRINQCLEDTK